MFPVVKRVLKSPRNDDDEEVESYADTYFREIGFKIGDNSCLSEESPDLDGEHFLAQDDDGLGLLEDNSLATDVERAIAAAPSSETGTPSSNYYKAHPPPRPHPGSLQNQSSSTLVSKKSERLTMAKAYNAPPFHSYFGQLLQDEGRNVMTSPSNYAVTSPSNYAISYNGADDVSISTLGEESIKRKPSPMCAQQRVQQQLQQRPVEPQQPSRKSSASLKKKTSTEPDRRFDKLGIQQSGTGSTLEERPSEDSTDLPVAGQYKKKTSKHSRSSCTSKDNVEEEEARRKKKWQLIYFLIGMSLILLAAASVVMGFTIVQLKKNKTEQDAAAAPTSTWRPNIGSSPTSDGTPPPPPTTVPGNDSHWDPLGLARSDFWEILGIVSPDSLEAVNDTSTPQYQAFEWTINDPEYLAYSVDRVMQRWAMAVLYFSLGGDAWKTSSSRRLNGNKDGGKAEWLSYTHNECQWYHIESNNKNICNDAGALVGLFLSGLGLTGTIPPEIALLGGSLGKSGRQKRLY